MRLVLVTLVLLLVACNAPMQTPANVPDATSAPSASETPQKVDLVTATLTPSATLILEQTSTPTASTTLVDPQQRCNELLTSANPGLYIVSVQPIPELVWDREPRRFDVRICNALGYATLNSLRFVVFVYFPSDPHPRGQTAEVTTQLQPGLNELNFESWTPGLQNHISACQQQPPVQIAVAYIFPPDLSALHPILYADGSDRQTFSVKCGGTFP